jgi:hypothetical protein
MTATGHVLACALLAVVPCANGNASEPLFDGLGTHSRKVTTENAKAQRYFNQGPLIILLRKSQCEVRRNWEMFRTGTGGWTWGCLNQSLIKTWQPRRWCRDSSSRLTAALCFRHEGDDEQDARGGGGAGHEQKRAGTAYMVADIAGDCGTERGAHAHCGADYALRQIVMASAVHDIGKDERDEHGKRCRGYAIEQLDCNHESRLAGCRKSSAADSECQQAQHK